MEFKKRYDQLNDAQKLAVDTIDGPVMVVAGPGTGKTELLSVRVANILQKTDTLPENILLLTFTESGQSAMRERLLGIIGKDAYKVAIHTFHSFGSEILGLNREYFYRNALFEPADDLKQYEVLRGIFEELERTHPLASMMNGEYTHLSDAKKVISELKRTSALTSDELLAVIKQSELSLDHIERILMPILSERVGKSTADQLRDAYELVREHANTVESLQEVTPLAHIIADSLATMLEETLGHPTKPISAWKSARTERNAAKELVFKDRKRLEKLRAFTYIYYEYLLRMEKLGLFDYDDMIMQVVHAIEENDELKFNLQEKYLYTMVDEFQDTNLAQLRILHSLTDNPVNEGNPNILVVGDDDQAVYGFQGADISNILNFSDTYPSHQKIVLTNNYRSGASILEASRGVIVQGTDRLEARDPDLDKKLSAHKKDAGTVTVLKASGIDNERHQIVRDIQRRITEGVNPSSIAVLARRHKDIESLLPFFHHAEVPVRYERDENVLDTAPIMALEQVARVVLALAEGKHDLVQELLPELLAHPAWNISPKSLWRLSLDAYTNRQNWAEVMDSTPAFTAIHEWLTARAQESSSLALEPMIDALMGRSQDETSESPYFTYFFSPESLAEHPEEYLAYLGALRAIRARLREYSPKETLSLASFIEFIELHRRLNIGISVKGYTLASDAPAVQLLTAHKSKGLEFDTVYVFNAVDSVWGQSVRGQSRSISYPENLPLAPTGNTADERLRLFYVAMTRAKQNLILTYSEANDGNKQTFEAGFLMQVELPVIEAAEATDQQTIETAELAWYQPLVTPTQELKTLLAPQIEKFKLSATSLNSFLDVSRGGPQHFLLNNLLHFPKSKAAPASYGTAVHFAMQQAHLHMAATGQVKPLEDTLHDFEVALTKERMAPSDFQHYLQQGSEHIPAFMGSGVLPVTPTQKAEVGFSYQDVRCGEAKLTGSLDMIDVNKEEKTITVTDYKTGHPSAAWEKGTDATKLKLHKYKQQLVFYKILTENSAEYHSFTVTHGQLAFVEPTPAGESIVLPLDLSTEDIERTKKLIEAVWKKICALDLPDTSQYSEDYKGVLAFEQDLIDEIV
ncbi:MAG: UvrD-helicase domain-containing protein [Candidatus Microsaccharimonas sp.]